MYILQANSEVIRRTYYNYNINLQNIDVIIIINKHYNL